MKWSDTAWEAIRPVYDNIIKHPFIKELLDGTLDHKKFTFYIQQDALYLGEYGRVLASIAARLKESADKNSFLRFAGETMEVEHALHQSFLSETDKNQQLEASPTCLLYTSYLLKHLALSSTEVILAAVLPCFWIYKEVGDYILANQKKEGKNPYQNWIDTYGGEEYARSVKTAIRICDEFAEQAGSTLLQDMTEAFVLCSKMEWMFWDSAYRLEQWQV